MKYSKTNSLKSFQIGSSKGPIEQKLSQHFEQHMKPSNLLKPFLFTVGVGISKMKRISIKSSFLNEQAIHIKNTINICLKI